ncbi:WD repeat-containing protein 44-like [Macadamia integrifolia]|uniref:WD repeat-containing protein 44-like n=1 Tax=Macadamia integrifolia TaxID=60698 RepID=UPI001C4F61B6|nr:WD repeat-containing protein 44-like [Macadamia integrifolia]
MADRKLMVMINWDGLGEDDDQFFESFDRMSSALAMDMMASSGSDDDEDQDYDDNRISFASCISAAPPEEFRGFTRTAAPSRRITQMSEDYDMWISEPGSIQERRKRLLQGMGLAGSASIKQGLCLRSPSVTKVSTTKIGEQQQEPKQKQRQIQPSPSPLLIPSTSIVRSKSDGNVASSFMIAQQRMEDLLGGSLKKHRLLRTASGDRKTQLQSPNSANLSLDRCGSRANASLSSLSLNGRGSGFVVIKNLDTGKEFIVNEFDNEGMWNRLKDLQTGKQLSREEFEKSVGYSPIVKELMRRENVSRDLSMVATERKASMNLQNLNPIIGRSLRNSKRRGAAWLKNIKGVANTVTGLIGDTEQRSVKNPSQWTKVRQQGKSYKELTGLYMSQEIQAHQGSIWTIRFSFDTHYLASAGEDRVIHIWEVMDCDVMSSASRSPEEGRSCSSTPIHPMASAIVASQQDRLPLGEAQVMPSEKKRKGKLSSSSKKGGRVPDYVMMPDTVFSLSEKPVCSFQGHLDDVLDLSWSKSQQLLSSSMDKTVRLWDMESKTCLKLFAHNDYVTCIQFNPIDDSYFISGSLDAKVRLWSIPDRQVVDWTDLHEMVTATCYTPDGQGALVGSHTGSCRLYNTSECKLNQKGQIDIHTKKKSGKKITGFEFAPTNPSEVLITSADSRIRIFDGSDIIHKFRGFRNTSSQISAAFTADGKYVVSASEDSQIYMWKRDEIKNIGGGGGKSKGMITTRSHEQFHCKDVSVAIPWPGCSTKYEPPTLPLQSKRHSKRSILPLLPPSGVSSLNLEEIAGMVSNNSRKNLPPLPNKKNNSILERASSSVVDERLSKTPSRTDSGISASSSFSSDSGYMKYGDSPSSSGLGKSSSSSSTLSWLDGGSSHSTGNNCIQATAWGLVIVAAGLGGELRIYQNFGLPIRLSRQSNLFRDHT